MVSQTASYAVGFTTPDTERSHFPLKVSGILPPWLNGTLLRTGPAKFEVQGDTYRHWFDGLAMLRAFNFTAPDRVHYSDRFLRSSSFCEAEANHHIQRSEFATNPDAPLWKRLILGNSTTDNGNVSISVMGGQPVALTETPTPHKIEPVTLETLERLDFEDELTGTVTTAHPHIDFERGELISYVIKFGRQCEYQFYRQSLEGDRRSLIASLPTSKPAYIHSFGLTSHYIVLVEFPLRVNPLRLATTQLHNTPFIENYRWQPELGTQFHLISRATGELVNTCQAAPCFAFHHVNAYEENDSVVVDISAYPDASLLEAFYLKHLRSGESGKFTQAKLHRFRVPLQGNTIQATTLSEAAMEFPRINYRRCNGLPYQFVFGGDNSSEAQFTDRLVKLNVNTGEQLTWSRPGHYPGEPVFVSAPDAQAEDDGVVLSVVLDAVAKHSYLLILDAKTLTEQVRATVPHVIPFGLHGQYFEDTKAPHQSPHLHR